MPLTLNLLDEVLKDHGHSSRNAQKTTCLSVTCEGVGDWLLGSGTHLCWSLSGCVIAHDASAITRLPNHVECGGKRPACEL